MVLHPFLQLYKLFYVLILLFFREPAPAITRHGPSTASTASFCLSFSPSNISILFFSPLILRLEYVYTFVVLAPLFCMLLALVLSFHIDLFLYLDKCMQVFLPCLRYRLFSFLILFREVWSIVSSFFILPAPSNSAVFPIFSASSSVT